MARGDAPYVFAQPAFEAARGWRRAGVAAAGGWRTTGGTTGAGGTGGTTGVGGGRCGLSTA